jgi:hypothetical protein
MVDLRADNTATAAFEGNPLNAAIFSGDRDSDWIRIDLVGALRPAHSKALRRRQPCRRHQWFQ